MYEFFAKDEDLNCHIGLEQYEFRLRWLGFPKVDKVLERRGELGLSTEKGRWLDVACGSGDMLGAVNQRGWHGVGFDISKPGVDMAKSFGNEAYCCDIKEFYARFFEGAEPMEMFDVVSCIGYFDLLITPREHLALIRKMLKPGGMVYIDQPRFDSATCDLIRAVPGRATRYLNFGQRSIFTDASLTRFYEEEGFDLVLKWKFGLDFYTMLSYLCMAYPALVESDIVGFCYKHYNEFQKVFDDNDYSDTLLFLGMLRD